MQAIFGIRHIRGTFGWHPVSAPLRAAALLAVLLTHLAFMVSPLHEWMLTGWSHPVAGAVATGEVAEINQRADDDRSGHCIIEWTKSAQGMALASLLAITSNIPVGGLERHLPKLHPLAQAHGPPHGDHQALLQVFRL